HVRRRIKLPAEMPARRAEHLSLKVHSLLGELLGRAVEDDRDPSLLDHLPHAGPLGQPDEARVISGRATERNPGEAKGVTEPAPVAVDVVLPRVSVRQIDLEIIRLLGNLARAHLVEGLELNLELLGEELRTFLSGGAFERPGR